MSIADIIFPKRCVQCSKKGEYVCGTHFADISFDVAPICLVCNKPSLDGLTHPICKGKYTIDGCWCAVRYKGIVPKLIYQFKYKPFLSQLAPFLAELLYENLIQNELIMTIIKNNPIFVPLPLSSKRLRQRGYNQSELLANELGRLFPCQIVPLLKRNKDTKPMYGLKKEEREQNIKGAFSISSVILGSIATPESLEKKDPGQAPPQSGKYSWGARMTKTIVLVDDILTSGSTLLEAAKILKKAGVEKVYGLCLARDE